MGKLWYKVEARKILKHKKKKVGAEGTEAETPFANSTLFRKAYLEKEKAYKYPHLNPQNNPLILLIAVQSSSLS